MGTTYRYLANSVMMTLKQRFDDSAITMPQVVLWIQHAVNAVRAPHIKKQDPSGAFLTIIDNVAVESDHLKQKFITLPRTIYDYEYDRGIEMIYYPNEKCNPFLVPFSRVDFGGLHRLQMDEYEKPTPEYPVFWRHHSHIHLGGLECIDVPYVILGIYDTIDFYNNICDLDTAIDVPEKLLLGIEKQVLDLARFGSIVTGDNTNDGVDLSSLKNRSSKGLEGKIDDISSTLSKARR